MARLPMFMVWRIVICGSGVLPSVLPLGSAGLCVLVLDMLVFVLLVHVLMVFVLLVMAEVRVVGPSPCSSANHVLLLD